MSSYVKNTDFASKDALLSGDPAKIIKGTEIDTEFNAISVAVSTKADTVSPTFTGTPTAPTASPGTNTTQVATTAFTAAAVTAATGTLGTMSTQAASSVAITGGSITGITDLTVADGGTGASSITANSVILGNGSLALSGNLVAPSTSGNVLTSNGTTWTSAAIPAQGIGVSQTWQDLTGSRSLATTYTNSTGKPIMVSVNTNSTTNTVTTTTLNIDSLAVAKNGSQGGNINGVTAIVPAGSTYSCTVGSGASLSAWFELR